MANEGDELIPTKASLLGRLKNSRDLSSWQEFFDTYRGLIYGVARKAGLSQEEAADVLQATMQSVADHMPSFRYDRRLGSFKAWLQNLTRLQIISRTLKRRPPAGTPSRDANAGEAESSRQNVDDMWDAEWKTNLFNAAVANVKRKLDPKKYQIYDLQVNKQWPVEKLAALMNLSVTDVMEAKWAVAEMIQAEVKRLEERMI